jgi:hypothetical protein
MTHKPIRYRDVPYAYINKDLYLKIVDEYEKDISEIGIIKAKYIQDKYLAMGGEMIFKYCFDTDDIQESRFNGKSII